MGTKLSDLSYVHDPDGNVAAIDDKVASTRSAIYRYDAMGRMNMTVAEVSATSASYTTTQGTNRLVSLTIPAGTPSTAYDSQGRLTSVPDGIGITRCGCDYRSNRPNAARRRARR